MAVRNIKLTIAYDGSSYHGWQIQPGQKTIQGVLAEAIENLLGSPIQLTGASRTDAGVSALGQAGFIQIDSPIPTENLAKAITDRLPDDIAVTEAVEVSDDFDVIGDVKSKLYRYTIFTGSIRPILQIRHCWYLPVKLDISAMSMAAEFLLGKQDFKSFASAADRRQSSVRTIFRCDVSTPPVIPAQAGIHNMNTQYENDWLYVDVEGDGFLYNMVRNIVGTLVEVGVGRWQPEKIPVVIQAKDRTAAGPIAPANGLCLMWIKY
ncbi:MAG: tRNA pseudouridine(38-40) synthase TruA [Planctomycetes bacterium]|nr:tRNA pseudouridine(38-40) synthase TruA [Planctomycetota bacterium]